MNRELKRRYVEELRNPERKQCFEKLRSNGTFCAIGLLLDIVDPEGWSPDDGRTHNFAAEGEEQTEDLFDETIIGSVEVASGIMQANDEGLTFAQIANIVELKVPEDDEPVNVQGLWNKIEQKRHDAEEDARAEACCCPDCADNE